MGTVSANANHTKSRCPTYFPRTNWNSDTGCASTISSVPVRRSSASARMVTAGITSRNTQGSRSSIGRSDATCIR